MSFKTNLKRKKRDDIEDSMQIFSKLNFETTKKTSTNEDLIDEIREKLMPIMLNKTFIKIIIALSVIVTP